MAQYVTLVYTLPELRGNYRSDTTHSASRGKCSYRCARDGAIIARYAHGYEASRYGLKRLGNCLGALGKRQGEATIQPTLPLVRQITILEKTPDDSSCLRCLWCWFNRRARRRYWFQ